MKGFVSNWGNYPVANVNETSFEDEIELHEIVNKAESVIARGNGRCYGDSSLADNIVSTLSFNKILSFNTSSGVIECESGVLLSDILDVVVPKGWFLPVTPGTKFVTIGGAVASDVHGKNHHKEGSFSAHVLSLELYTCEENKIKCSIAENRDLFEATMGGMGLTGIITRVKFQLKKIETSYIKQTQIKASNLDEILDLFETYNSYTYSMAWIDCLKGGRGLGRSIIIVGEHARLDQLDSKMKNKALKVPSKTKFSIPFKFPSFILNKWSIKLFNILYYAKNIKRRTESVTDYDSFFYPLDSILHWNNMYGSRGFVQYQFVVPSTVGREGLRRILMAIQKKGMGSFLAVLKHFGEQDDLLSFPMKGYTLALDFPIKRGLFDFLNELDELVLDLGGRIYLTKDARMSRKMFMESYPNVDAFVNIVKKYNCDNKFSSFQSKRLFDL